VSAWVDPNVHGWVLHRSDDEDWRALLQQYGGRYPDPLEQILRVVSEAGCRTIVVENRYVDLDYRSEYSAFWSLRFQGPSPFARRLHFFTDHLEDGGIHTLPEGVGYLGYSVIRPVKDGPVGRTVIAPPPSLADATLTLVEDHVSLFGNDLTVKGVPFCQQDGEYLRCAHAAVWMCHYTACKLGLAGRQTTAAIVGKSPSMLSWERALPSKGMTLNQLQAVFGALGQPALFYGLSNMPRVRGVPDPEPAVDSNQRAIPAGLWDTRIFSVVCRYLNSGFPVLIGTEDHAFVIVGWQRDRDEVRFIACDDQVGPYEILDSPFAHYKTPWLSIMIPLPPKVFLSGEVAESRAYNILSAVGTRGLAPLASGLAAGGIQLRSSLKTGRDFKRAVASQASSDSVLRLVRLARLPHWVWTVEAHVPAACKDGGPCVVAEVVLDSTSSDLAPRTDLVALPGLVATFPPDGGDIDTEEASTELWTSLLENH
jgi:hypothetical protein